jgi:hypothetical protein
VHDSVTSPLTCTYGTGWNAETRTSYLEGLVTGSWGVQIPPPTPTTCRNQQAPIAALSSRAFVRPRQTADQVLGRAAWRARAGEHRDRAEPRAAHLHPGRDRALILEGDADLVGQSRPVQSAQRALRTRLHARCSPSTEWVSRPALGKPRSAMILLGRWWLTPMIAGDLGDADGRGLRHGATRRPQTFWKVTGVTRPGSRLCQHTHEQCISGRIVGSWTASVVLSRESIRGR